jgi:hypothetical protein
MKKGAYVPFFDKYSFVFAKNSKFLNFRPNLKNQL